MLQMKKRPLTRLQKVLAVCLGIVIVLLLVLLAARMYFRLPVSRYYRASEKGFRIPGLQDGLIPQGIDYDARSDCFFVTGYADDGSASPIYLVSASENKEGKTVYMAKEDGTPFDGHAGGIALSRDYIYIAGGEDCCIYVYGYDAVMTAENGTSVDCLGQISTGDAADGIRVSCLTVDDNYLYAAEFYHEPSYPTPDSHKMTTKAGDDQQALAVAYALSDATDAVFGVEPMPSFGYSLPDRTQGICFHEGEVYLSTSYGAAFSYIYAYSLDRLTYQTDLTLQGGLVPIYALDSDSRTREIKLAPMSEEIVFVDDKLYTMCESASNRYLFGKLTSAKWCYATDVERYR